MVFDDMGSSESYVKSKEQTKISTTSGKVIYDREKEYETKGPEKFVNGVVEQKRKQEHQTMVAGLTGVKEIQHIEEMQGSNYTKNARAAMMPE